MRIYENVRRLAKEKGIAITKIEEELGFSRGSIGKWDKHEPSLKKALEVAAFLEADIRELIK